MLEEKKKATYKGDGVNMKIKHLVEKVLKYTFILKNFEIVKNAEKCEVLKNCT